MSALLNKKLSVINVGLASFAENLVACGAEVRALAWQPPAEGDRDLGWILARLCADPRVDEANKIAYARYLAVQPMLVGIGMAREVLPDMTGKIILHSGPPVFWDDMCGPQQGAVLGAVLFEGWADSLDAARTMLERGEVRLDPCHHHQAVGPMAGILSPSMPVFKVTDPATGRMAYSNMNEGLGKVLRFGANGSEVIERLVWMKNVLAPTLATVISEMGGIELKPLMAQALHMGDEVHNRNVAASSLLFKRLTTVALKSKQLKTEDVAQSLAFIAGNDHFFLNISMAACKLMLDAADGVPFSSMVTAMARNGTEFGIRLSGVSGWFVAPSPMVNGLFFPGYSEADAARDLGDSAITETAGVGGFAMAAAPAIVQFVGGTARDALENTRRMLNITLGQNSAFTLPALNFTGSPAGIDARLVVDTGILPVINTGIAHKNAGVGQVGAGITYAPLSCFAKALKALSDTMGE